MLNLSQARSSWTAADAIIALFAAWLLWTPDKQLATLERNYLRAPGDRMTVLGVDLHVRVSGPQDALAVLLLHGFGASLHTWEPWAETLSRDMRVVSMLKRISAPTLLLWGQQDGMIPFANSADYVKAITNNRLVALDNDGHLPHEEIPERSLAPVRDFLLER